MLAANCVQTVFAIRRRIRAATSAAQSGGAAKVPTYFL
jgi:hypothetical protein